MKEDHLSKVENGGVVPFRHIKKGVPCHYGTEDRTGGLSGWLRRLGGRGSVRGSPCDEPARLRFTSLCPPFFLLRGYPRERISYGSGAPPPAAAPPDPPVACAFYAIVTRYAIFYVPEWHDPSVFNL